MHLFVNGDNKRLEQDPFKRAREAPYMCDADFNFQYSPTLVTSTCLKEVPLIGPEVRLYSIQRQKIP